ncbi:MAG: MMPL family transporter [Planctomycetota bacterium]|nr:MMPL family transporter [Planctomycetota bacterium]
MYRWLGQLAANHPWKICFAWILFGVTAAFLAPSWEKNSQDDDIRFLPARCDSVRGYKLLEEAFPNDIFASKAIFLVERKQGPFSPEDYVYLDKAVTAIKQLAKDEPDLQIGKVLYEKEPVIGKKLKSIDETCTLVQVFLATPFMANQTRLTVDKAEKVFREHFPTQEGGAVQIKVTGIAAVGRDLISAGASSLDSTTLATILLVIVTLLFVYRAPGLAIIPLITIVLSVWIALNLLALCTLIKGFHLMNISKIFAIVMLYGAGTDYCLFLISRYREELCNGLNPKEAIAAAVEHVGHAIVASAGTVICGLSLMILAEFAKVRCGGPAIALGLTVALFASLTLAPALLRLCGHLAFWPGKLPVAIAPEKEHAAWFRFGDMVVSHPIRALAVITVALVPLAIIGLQVTPNYNTTGELSRKSQSVLGLQAIQEHFTPGELGPVIVLLESNKPWDNQEGKRLLSHLSQGFLKLSGVSEVRSLTQPLGIPVKEPKGINEDAQGILGRSRVINAEIYGLTVAAQDMSTVTESDRFRINWMVLVGIFLILLYLVRSPWLAAYLLVTVLFSYFVTLGATALMAHWYDGRAIGELDWRVPFFLFIILVAVGEDYNIFLITRMIQEKEIHGAVEGTRKALALTGGTITSCGLIMAGTFATLMLAGLNTLFQIGFALAFGVLLDTFIVRPILVPAFTVLIWKKLEGSETAKIHRLRYREKLRKAV